MYINASWDLPVPLTCAGLNREVIMALPIWSRTGQEQNCNVLSFYNTSSILQAGLRVVICNWSEKIKSFSCRTWGNVGLLLSISCWHWAAISLLPLNPYNPEPRSAHDWPPSHSVCLAVLLWNPEQSPCLIPSPWVHSKWSNSQAELLLTLLMTCWKPEDPWGCLDTRLWISAK